MRYKYYTSQMDEEDCGVAALAMILKNYGSIIPLAKLRSLAKTTVEGTTIYGIVKAAKAYNLDALAIKANKELFKIEDLSFPFIIHVTKERKYLHYYVVTEIDDDLVTIADPDSSVGVIKISVAKLLDEWNGAAIFFSKNEKYVAVIEQNIDLARLARMLLKNKKIISLILSMASAILMMNVINSLAIQFIIDNTIPRAQVNALTAIVIGLMVMYIFNSCFLFIENFAMTLLGKKVSKDIVLRFMKHLFSLPLEFFATRRTGDIIVRFNDTNKVIEALSNSVVTLFLDVLIVLTMGIVLAIQNIQLLFIVILFLPIYLVIIFSFSKIFKKKNQIVMEKNAKISSLIIDNIKGIETVKALNAEEEQLIKIKHSFENFLDELMSYSICNSSQEAIKQFFQLLLNVLIIWLGAIQIIDHNFKLGQLIAFSALLGYFTTSLKNILDLQSKLQSAEVANKRLKDILTVPVEAKMGNIIQNVKDLVGNIEFNNVSCRYGYQNLVLKNINLKINQGEKLALVGSSGSGKSTIAKMLVGFLNPSQGLITLNDINIENIDKKTLRSYINYVPQAPYTISDTIWNNLTLGCSFKVTKDEVDEACKIAMIDDFINTLPLGYNTKLDEDATIFSGGQKQRITIARAILSKSKVIIFDESTSGLDALTERKIVTNLLKLENRTIIFIVHRLSVAKLVNNILVLENGNIIEQGTHMQLLKNGEIYRQFVAAS